MTVEERAWAAGFFEGEGCISSCRDPRKGNVRMVMAVTNTDLDRLEMFQRIMGRGRIYVKQPDARRPTVVKPMWQWRVAAIADVLACFEILAPWLGPRRLEQFRVHMARYAEAQRTKGARVAEGRRQGWERRRARAS